MEHVACSAPTETGACIGPWLIHRQFLLPSINVRQPIEVSFASALRCSAANNAALTVHFQAVHKVRITQAKAPLCRPQRLRTAAQLHREGSGRALALFCLLRMV